MKKLYRIFSRKMLSLDLKQKLLYTYLFVATVPIIIIGTVSYSKSSEIIINQTENYAQLTIEQINKDIDAYVDKIERITYTVYSNLEFQKIIDTYSTSPLTEQLDNRDIIYQLLFGIKIIDPGIDGVYLYTDDGNLFCANNMECNTEMEGYDFSRIEWFSGIVEGKYKSYLSPIHEEVKYEREDNNRNFSYIRSLININNGNYLGFLLVDIDQRVIDNIVGESASKIQGRIFILDDYNRVMYDSYNKKFGKTIYFDKGQPTHNDNIVISHQSPKTGWHTVFVTPISNLKKKVNEIRRFTGVIAITCALVFIFISSLISSSISNPLRQLKQAIDLVEMGDLDTEVKVRAGDEIGKLSDSFNKMVKSIRTLIEEVYESQLRQKEAELYALQSQINPHFMYNTLETINMLAILDGNLEISDIISSFSNILRFNLDHRTQSISVKNEMMYVSDYLNIQRARYKDRLNVKVEMDPIVEDMEMLKFTIQPLVENAIIHGISKKDTPGTIHIELGTRGQDLRVSVKDNGVGIAPEILAKINESLKSEKALNKVGSIGLNNINERIKLQNGEKYGIAIESIENIGTEVIVTMPIRFIEGENEDV